MRPICNSVLKKLYRAKLTVDALYARNRFYNTCDKVNPNRWMVHDDMEASPTKLPIPNHDAICAYWDYIIAIKRKDNYI